MAAIHECQHVFLTVKSFLQDYAICYYLVEPILSFLGQCLLQVVTHCIKPPFSLVVIYVFFFIIKQYLCVQLEKEQQDIPLTKYKVSQSPQQYQPTIALTLLHSLGTKWQKIFFQLHSVPVLHKAFRITVLIPI